MKIECKFKFKYPDEKIAENIKNSLEIDNKDYIKTELLGDTLVAKMEADSSMSLLHTIEDYLSCLTTAENLLLKK